MCKTDTGTYFTWVPMQIEAQKIHREVTLQMSGSRKYFMRIWIRGFGILNYGSGWNCVVAMYGTVYYQIYKIFRSVLKFRWIFDQIKGSGYFLRSRIRGAVLQNYGSGSERSVNYETTGSGTPLHNLFFLTLDGKEVGCLLVYRTSVFMQFRAAMPGSRALREQAWKCPCCMRGRSTRYATQIQHTTCRSASFVHGFQSVP